MENTNNLQNALTNWGYSSRRRADFEATTAGISGCVPGRVCTEHKGMYRVVTETGFCLAQVSGRLRHDARSRADYPAVGDWVALQLMDGEERGVIQAILPRTSVFMRKVAGAVTEEQIVGTNIDQVLLVNALNQDYNLRRLERYLILAWESGAAPVVVLTKADLCEDAAAKALEVEVTAPGVPVLVTSVLSGEGLDAVRELAAPGQTLGLLGSSGAGKSSLVNVLLGRDVQAVQEVRGGDDRGRHTTTHRELFQLPGGGVVLDTPGMRELQLWHADEGFGEAFEDIEALAARCRFRDCTHRGERDCAVAAALASGELDAARYDNYRKLQKELAYLARKDAEHRRAQERAAGKMHAQHLREHYRSKR